MALTAPKQSQISFAKQIAWERGQRLAVVPETSSALSGVIETLLADFEPLPIHERQIEQIRDLNRDCVAKLDGFTPYDELPADRASANKLIFSLRRRLSASEFHAAKAGAASYLVAADAPTTVTADDAAATVVDDLPF